MTLACEQEATARRQNRGRAPQDSDFDPDGSESEEEPTSGKAEQQDEEVGADP